MPRITRAQSMDVLSSMATIAGYKAVLLAATDLPKLFPMLMTAAGTITPAQAFGAGRRRRGAAGHRHRATARARGQRVRRAPRGQGADRKPGREVRRARCRSRAAEDKGGYAKAMDEEFYKRQRELLAEVVARAGRGHHHRRRSRQEGAHPDHQEMVEAMAPGSVIVDHRGRARRQLRADAARRDGGAQRRHYPGAGELPVDGSVPRQPDVSRANVATFLKTARQGRAARPTAPTRFARRWWPTAARWSIRACEAAGTGASQERHNRFDDLRI